ncbi:monocarboxylate transporter 5-like [Acanthaster planci]|uniref:Monocarboxylate transporter 5-like n=1 Tax=Acanthaster planci TaxID=133434 RepID=A0A8B7YAT1_ACAPL|nr:monocarboxylate transporter 5-like [Acanthaster planci]XP_022089656.1 monocarboxylate transporter 5-like [Acanthaster planci]XP_022089657.1 monocarboxylate transporter 5-like [Acanthaster planci]XP_022089658.1 monocarboxylate transporter 5-like [Acanthaster planci]XP_022089659.1 monocarboxylate transporter 5-like [Acanthaster planci]XP_022089660.1 monocarboxylate transporter 5-like [Acanthaster planci]XP_022089662.1 monocarboxylate transporter 5-like [Acanthaster planci]
MGRCRSLLARHRGWVVTAAAFVMFVVATGTLGVFLLLYVHFEREFQDSATAIGWIGSLANGLLNLTSFVSSPLYERFTRRKIIVLGILLCSAGILATSFTRALWQIYLTFGVVFAVGLNFLCNPALNMLTIYFPGKNCVRATALASGGQTVGTLLLTPILEAVLSVIGWRQTLQVQAIVIFVICLPLAVVFKTPSLRPTRLDSVAEDAGTPAEQEKLNMMKVGGAPSAEGDENSYRKTEGDGEEDACLEPDLAQDQGSGDCASPDGNEEHEANSLTEPVNSSEKTVEDSVGGGRQRYPNTWQKYVRLMKDSRHAFFFLATLATALSVTFNGINLISCMTVGGIPESTAAWLITLMCIVDLVSRFFFAFTGDSLPFQRIFLLAVGSAFGAAGSFLLTRGTSLWIFALYAVVAGFVRSIAFGLGWACVVDLFGADRTVETLTSVQISYGIGGLLASSVAGLSYDLTGTYQTTHFICMGLWALSSLCYAVVHQWSRITSCRPKVNRPSHLATLN